jgi:hypothetical protein
LYKYSISFHMKTSYGMLLRMLFSFSLLYTGILQVSSQEFKPFKELDSIPEDKAVVYIYWPNMAPGGMEYVIVNDRFASFLPLYSRGCLVYIADPGINVFNTSNSRKGNLVLQIYPGESVFIQGIFKSGETTFRRIPPAAALKELNKCRLYEKQCIIDSDKFRSIALLSTTISRADLPITPILDASAFNERVYSILDKIVAMQKINLYQLRDNVAHEISQYFKAKVVFGDSLNLIPEVKELQKKYNKINQIMINDKSYPALVTIQDDIKPFSSYNDNCNHFFRDDDKYKEIISEIGHVLKTDLIAICNMNYSLYTNSYSLGGGINLNTQLFLFSPDGTLVAKGDKMLTSSGSISGNSIRDYENALKMLPSTLDLILEEITCDLCDKMKK